MGGGTMGNGGGAFEGPPRILPRDEVDLQEGPWEQYRLARAGRAPFEDCMRHFLSSQNIRARRAASSGWEWHVYEDEQGERHISGGPPAEDPVGAGEE